MYKLLRIRYSVTKTCRNCNTSFDTKEEIFLDKHWKIGDSSPFFTGDASQSVSIADKFWIYNLPNDYKSVRGTVSDTRSDWGYNRSHFRGYH